MALGWRKVSAARVSEDKVEQLLKTKQLELLLLQ